MPATQKPLDALGVKRVSIVQVLLEIRNTIAIRISAGVRSVFRVEAMNQLPPIRHAISVIIRGEGDDLIERSGIGVGEDKVRRPHNELTNMLPASIVEVGLVQDSHLLRIRRRKRQIRKVARGRYFQPPTGYARTFRRWDLPFQRERIRGRLGQEEALHQTIGEISKPTRAKPSITSNICVSDKRAICPFQPAIHQSVRVWKIQV